MERKGNAILELSLEFALEIIDFCEELDSKRKYVISKQLLRSGTSIGANVHEAQSPESRADFIHKMKIASKEASETEYWLILCHRAKKYPNTQKLLNKLLSIQKLLSAIISSSNKRK